MVVCSLSVVPTQTPKFQRVCNTLRKKVQYDSAISTDRASGSMELHLLDYNYIMCFTALYQNIYIEGKQYLMILLIWEITILSLLLKPCSHLPQEPIVQLSSL